MPTTPLQRMMFLQGGLCFFCNRTIPKAEASVEHLVPTSGGGTNDPDNLVACCKTLNALFGSMTVKEKLRAILKQNGKFLCPNQTAQPQNNSTPAKPVKSTKHNGTQTNMPANQGKPWTPEEEAGLAKAFDAETPIPQLATLFKRSIAGIEARLTKLGKRTPEHQARFATQS